MNVGRPDFESKLKCKMKKDTLFYSVLLFLLSASLAAYLHVTLPWLPGYLATWQLPAGTATMRDMDPLGHRHRYGVLVRAPCSCRSPYPPNPPTEYLWCENLRKRLMLQQLQQLACADQDFGDFDWLIGCIPGCLRCSVSGPQEASRNGGVSGSRGRAQGAQSLTRP